MVKSKTHKASTHKKHSKHKKKSWLQKLEGKLLYVLYALIILIFLITTIHASMFSQDDYEGMGDMSDCCGECCGEDCGCVDEKDDDDDDTEDTNTSYVNDTPVAGTSCTTTTKSISSTAGSTEFTGSFSIHYCGEDTTLKVYFTRQAGAIYVPGAIYSDWTLPGYNSITITNNSDVGTSWSFPASRNFSKACMVIGSSEECG